jgi:hypothetical protein
MGSFDVCSFVCLLLLNSFVLTNFSDLCDAGVRYVGNYFGEKDGYSAVNPASVDNAVVLRRYVDFESKLCPNLKTTKVILLMLQQAYKKRR